MGELQEITGKSLIGMPVYSIREGIGLGQVKSLLIEAKDQCVLALIVERRRFNREEKILPFSAISGIGEDAITVEKASLLERKGINTLYLRALKHPVQLIGAKVFTVGGKTLGKVEEYRLENNK
ncbi:MAG: PRC-barrel domain-containing protein [Clostridiales bacterium]